MANWISWVQSSINHPYYCVTSSIYDGSYGESMYTQSSMVQGMSESHSGPHGGQTGMLHGPPQGFVQQNSVTTTLQSGFGQWNPGIQGQVKSSGANWFPFDNQFVPRRQYFCQFPYTANMVYMGQGKTNFGMTYGYPGQVIQVYQGGYPGP